MKIISVQLAAGNRSKKEQIERARKLIDRVGDTDLILLPELWTTGAFAYERMAADAEKLEDGQTITVMKEIAKERGCHLFAGSWVERSEDGLHNTAVFIAPNGETLATYRKIHLFGYQSKEQELMIAGDRPVVVETPFGRFGLATCYDLRFPELFRILLDMGAECFLITSGWPFPRLEHWKLLNRSRALENLCFLVSCNSCDEQDEVRFCGHSMAVDPWGNTMATLDEKEGVLVVDLDLPRANEIRSEFPALQDRVLGNIPNQV